ncbi:Co(2+)/Mg(2+) efflux protein ApaG [Candidatus Bealeia paramacronuclearis]|uniref:Protein ApaG n=1 Tax=Candidatus Bealeia paramacronuclearis TaxID=1921001 RepID=A0ABZ2C560_9PROT|nr:Co(2+)/Mg(2+) efflux protein ApaG [Candidatus Bealeia paramacronuclearis]
MNSLVTHDIKVSVAVTFLDEESNPQEHHFLWGYQIWIENLGQSTIQLLSRHWCITDQIGITQEVRGKGVVGVQPVIDKGESYTYTSGVPLTTPSGIMAGEYTVQDEYGDLFEIIVPPFSLDSPYETRLLN